MKKKQRRLAIAAVPVLFLAILSWRATIAIVSDFYCPTADRQCRIRHWVSTLSEQKSKERNQRSESPQLDELLANFVPCGRCSFFLAGYRVLHGPEHLAATAAHIENGWLDLRWDEELRDLVQRSYGRALDVDIDYYDSRCPECHRRFVFRGAQEPGEHDSFRIELK